MESNRLKNTLLFIHTLILAILLGYFLPHKLSILYDWNFISILYQVPIVIISFGILFPLYRRWTKKDKIEELVFPSFNLKLPDSKYQLNEILKLLKEKIADSKYSALRTVKIIEDFSNKTNALMHRFNEDKAFELLVEQYEQSVENERFYEKTIWNIAAIFVPVSLSLPTFSITANSNIFGPVIGFIIYSIFLILFQRFRVTIRLFREYSIFLEQILYLNSHTFVYKNSFKGNRPFLRVWTILTNIGMLYFNFILYLLISQIAG